mgnify:FL=1|jgi:hypothetical protein|tara:strand:+ start:1063 stop:1362 length:300 start_codon:yes stop_codon:yes gene_type:complete
MNTRGIGNFLEWAHQRIVREMKTNELAKAEFGEEEVYGEKPSERRRITRNNNERMGLVKEIDKLRRLGMTCSLACKSVGISRSSYNKFRVKLKLEPFQK